MPHVPRPVLVRIAATEQEVRRVLEARLACTPDGRGGYVSRPGGAPDEDTRVDVEVVASEAETGETTVAFTGHPIVRIPFWAWAFRGLVAVALRRWRHFAVATLRAELEGGPRPEPPKAVVGLPDVMYSREQAVLLASAAAATAVVSYASALFGQLADPISESFDVSDSRLGVALAVTRIGALVALVITMLADRRGRRRVILFGLGGSAVACGISALAPTFAVFTAAQVFQRACVITTGTVAGIAVIEEAPEGARAFSATMLALAGGFGFSFAVLTVPLSDAGAEAWRVAYGLGAVTVLLLPSIARHLRETRRYEALVARAEIARGRARDVLRSGYRHRFVVLGIVAFLANVFSAPSSQLMNKYLSDDRGFSGSWIALFRSVTAVVPGIVGLLLGGRLAEQRGRRPVAAVALFVATATQMVFFLAGGAVLWIAAAASVVTSAAAAIALGTLDAELFPTETRSTSNAFLGVVSVIGSAVGLVLAGVLTDPLGGIGRAVALSGIAALVAAAVFVPMLPESAARALDDVSPTGHAPALEDER
jgi:MFS family permease